MLILYIKNTIGIVVVDVDNYCCCNAKARHSSNLVVWIGTSQMTKSRVNLTVTLKKSSDRKNKDMEFTSSSNPLLESNVIPTPCHLIWFDLCFDDSIRFDSIQFNSIQFNSFRFDLIWFDLIWFDLILAWVSW